MTNKQNSIKSYAGFIGITSFLFLFTTAFILLIERTTSYSFSADNSLFSFFFEYQNLFFSTSELQYNENKNFRVYGLFIPLIVFIASIVFYFRFGKRKEATNNRVAFFLSTVALSISVLLEVPIIFVILAFFVISFIVLKKYKEKIKEEKILKLLTLNTFIKMTLFALTSYFLLAFFVFHLVGNITGKHNHYLNNNITIVQNSILNNNCFLNSKKNTVIYNFQSEKCYHDQFDKDINNSKILFISLIDKNGGLLDISNYEFLINSITNIKNEDEIYLYQKTYEGLVAKNNQFKSQKYYDHNIKTLQSGDQIIKLEKTFYEASKTMSTVDFIDFVKKSKNKSIILYNSFQDNELENKDKLSFTPISMEDIRDLEIKFNKKTKEDNVIKQNLYLDVLFNAEKFLAFLKNPELIHR